MTASLQAGLFRHEDHPRYAKPHAATLLDNAADEFYSCAQAKDLYEGGEPGSACTDPDRAREPCDCGRDARVARLLGIIASEWEDK